MQQFDLSGCIALLSRSDEGKLSGAAAQLASEGRAVHITGLDATAIAPAVEKLKAGLASAAGCGIALEFAADGGFAAL